MLAPSSGTPSSRRRVDRAVKFDFHAGDKHTAIINQILATHSAHILEFSDFLDSRYQAMMRELCKQPEDIEGADSA